MKQKKEDIAEIRAKAKKFDRLVDFVEKNKSMSLTWEGFLREFSKEFLDYGK